MKISTVSVKASVVMLVTFCLVGSLTVGCSADWLYLYSIEELTQRADVILVGMVESIINCPDLDNVPYWSRQVQVSVERYLKHFIESTNVSVIVDGATFGNNTYGAFGNTPEFEESERVLLFLEEGVNGFFKLLRGSQGKFTIVDDTAVSEAGRVIENVRGFTETDIKYRRMVDEADFIVIGTPSEVGAPDMMLRTIEVEEYLKDPRNDSQITLRVTDEDTAGGEFSNAYASPLRSTGKVLVFVVFHEGFNRLLDGTYGVYQVMKKTSSDPDTWRVRKTWLTSREESTINYVHYYYDVVKPDMRRSP